MGATHGASVGGGHLAEGSRGTGSSSEDLGDTVSGVVPEVSSRTLEAVWDFDKPLNSRHPLLFKRLIF